MPSKAEVFRMISVGSLLVSGCASEINYRKNEIIEKKERSTATSFSIPKPMELGSVYPTPVPDEIFLDDTFKYPFEISPQIDYWSTVRGYEGRSAKLIDNVENKYGVDLVSTTTWIHGKTVWENLAWSEGEIEILVEAIDSLPPSYFFENERSPKEVFLIKRPGTDFDDLDGGYTDRKIYLEMPYLFPLDSPMPAPTGAYISNYGDYFKLVIGHEWTHSFTESHPELVDEWAQKTGWYKKSDGSWGNDNYWVVFPDIEVLDNPVEDIASSIGLMLVNPQVLTDDRKEFFLSNEFYSEWAGNLINSFPD